MTWLARLKKQKGPDTHPTKPTEPTEPGFVGFVGTPEGHIQKISGSVEPANDAPATWNVVIPPGTSAAPIATFRAAPMALDAAQRAAGAPPSRDPDADCWPHSTAMTGAEIDTFTARLARFTDKGLLDLDAGERLADKLVIRGREQDDRRQCLECTHLHPGGAAGAAATGSGPVWPSGRGMRSCPPTLWASCSGATGLPMRCQPEKAGGKQDDGNQEQKIWSLEVG